MRVSAKTLRVVMALALLSILFLFERAAPLSFGAARSFLRGPGISVHKFSLNSQSRTRTESGRAQVKLPSPASFRESEGRGLLVIVWVNGAGPYQFAIDTGAGANILSRHVAAQARVEVDAGGGNIRVGGLSGASREGARRAYVRSFTVGSRSNVLPSQGFTVIADGLPDGVDGVLDPSETYSPLGYVIDMPNETISAFDPRRAPLNHANAPAGGAVVRWLTESGNRRPFVLLAEGRRALIDTGSGFGLAVGAEAARALGVIGGRGRESDGARDLGGGEIPSRRVKPTTINIGTLALRNVPTDYLPRVGTDAPVILGRDALRPFRIAFDPVNRLISFSPS